MTGASALQPDSSGVSMTLRRAGVAFTRAVVAASMMAGDSPQGVKVARVHNGGVVGEWIRPRQIRGQ